MKVNGASFLIACLCLSLAGCVSPHGDPDNTASGALIGGATDAIIGSAVAVSYTHLTLPTNREV